MKPLKRTLLVAAAGSEEDAELLARCIWARITEPADPIVGALLATIGPVEALEWLGYLSPSESSASGPSKPLAQMPSELRQLAPAILKRLRAAVVRWQPRLAHIDANREMRALVRFNEREGRIIGPGHGEWPEQLDDLGFEAPVCMWIRGTGHLARSAERSIALVGARAATMYGQEVTAQLVSGLCDRGFTIVSGGAYGIDITASRVAMATGGRTVAVMAGGVDRLYPRGNSHTLEQSLETGLVISEHPPASAPTRSRFLTRNRIIAALSHAVIVVEAALRSGAISTARHGIKLGRPLGAVPGPVTSMMSAGCHELLRNEQATCITDAQEAAEIAGKIGADLREEPSVQPTLFDTLDTVEMAVAEALPLRRGVGVAAIARTAAVSVEEALATLARLEIRGVAARDGAAWRRSNKAW